MSCCTCSSSHTTAENCCSNVSMNLPARATIAATSASGIVAPLCAGTRLVPAMSATHRATRVRTVKLRPAALILVLLQFFQRPWPVFPQQPRERPVGQQLPACLTRRAVVCLIRRVTNPLNRGAAHGARLAEPAVRRHAWPERRHLLR